MRYTDEWILAAMHAVIDSSDDTGCSEDLTVTSKAALDRLRVVLGHARKNNEQARDLKRLVKLALETQDAANPRPLSTLLTNLIQDKTIRFSLWYPFQWPRTIGLLAHAKVDTGPIITHSAALDGIGAAIDRVVKREEGVLKTVIVP